MAALRIPEKANRILNGVLVVLILIAIRIWHLAVIQHDKKVEESQKPQRRVVIERADRAPISDRFGVPLAVNKVQYNISLVYAPIKNVPRMVWRTDERGKKIKHLFRKEYVAKLCATLGEELHLDPEKIEDLLYAKAAILGNVPCLLKENISEEQYFRLKMLEKEWPSIHAEIASKRYYPQGPVGAELIGYLGPISKNEYEAITGEMRELRERVALWEEGEVASFTTECPTIEAASARLEELEKKAYTLNDYVGKVGVEAIYDEQLRGLRGKKVFLSDPRGNFLEELEGSDEPASGAPLTLTISAELQAYAESLLAEYESSPACLSTEVPPYQPWIKGGAIVAMDPKTGEVYALASFPRFNPNDFVLTAETEELDAKKKKIHQWLENETHIAHLWDLKIPHKRYVHDGGVQECIELTWWNYLDFILLSGSKIRHVLKTKHTISEAIDIQKKIESLLSFFHGLSPHKVFDFLYSEAIPTGVVVSLPEQELLDRYYRENKEQIDTFKNALEPFFASLAQNYEKLLLVDLYRLCIDPALFSEELLSQLGEFSIAAYREFSGRLVTVNETLHQIVHDYFRETAFRQWRDKEFKTYLAACRRREKEEKKKYARPYLDYLEHAEKKLFEAFWEKYQWKCLVFFLTGKTIIKDPEIIPYLRIIGTWKKEIEKGAHSALTWIHSYFRIQELLPQIDSNSLELYLKSHRGFKNLTHPLMGSYPGLRGKLLKDLASAFYPTYGFGYARSHAFRQATSIGSIFKLVPAYEALRQRYLAFKEKGISNGDLNPLTIVDDKKSTADGWIVGQTLEGKVIPQFYRGGRLPRSDHFNIGRIDLVKAFEASSNLYFALLAGDVLEDPEDLYAAANLLGFGEKTGIDLPGEYKGRLPNDCIYNRSGLYAFSIGQHTLAGTPLQTACMLATIANGGEVLTPRILKKAGEKMVKKEVRWNALLPPQIQSPLLNGMKQVVMGEKGTARSLRTQFPELAHFLIGKTSTPESIERLGLDRSASALKVKHIMFGSIAYETKDFSKPELVVVVYLRYGGYGNDAAPYAAKIVKKWREIKMKNQS